MISLIALIAFNAAAQSSVVPRLTLGVRIIGGPSSNVLYTARYSNTSATSAILPVVTFYCNGRVVGRAQVDKTGTATLRLDQKPGVYVAQAIIEVAYRPIKSNIVKYKVPEGLY